MNHTKADSLYACEILVNVLLINKNILTDDKETASLLLKNLESLKKQLKIEKGDLTFVFKTSALNLAKINEFNEQLTTIIEAMSDTTN